MMEVMYLGSILLGVLISSTLGYENLAFNKPATMSSYYNASYFPASKAVDGDRSREQLDCTFTGVNQTEAWWRVDLGALKSIVSINFTYGKTGQEAQLNPITRLIYGQTENDGLLQIFHYETDTSGRWGTICNQEFDEVDALVSCFGAGHLPDGAEYYTLNNYTLIWLSRLRCNGNEPSPHNCPKGIPDFGDVDNSCKNNMDVGLRCKNGSTLVGFSVIVSETDNMTDGQMCYHDTGTSIPSTNMDIPCKAIGRYVFFYNERKPGTNYPDFYSQYAYIQLAELEVYGCEGGQFGTACNQSCPTECANSQCDVENGNCLKCAAGYKSLPMCHKECDDGYFGEDCALSCGNCKNNAPCHHITGRCEDGCSSGWLTIHCNETCFSGNYGDQCSQSCNSNCLNTSDCHHVTGTCVGGCNRGWRGKICNEECADGSYGFNCSSTCNGCAKSCNKRTGVCLIYDPLCQSGFYGPMCENGCTQTTYGPDCKKNCSENCLNSTCNATTGYCLACIATMEGNFCNIRKEGLQLNETSVAAIGAGIGVVIIILIVLLVVFLIILRKRRKAKDNAFDDLISPNNITPVKRKRKKSSKFFSSNGSSEIRLTKIVYENIGTVQPPEEKNDETDDEDLKISDDDNQDYEYQYNELKLFRDIAIGELQGYIQFKQAGDNAAFKEEFKALPRGEQASCKTGKLDKNLNKNRFKNTIAYDHSRVLLQSGVEGSDYINANYIEGFSKDKQYIASQGPKPNTVVDFWKMIWDENVPCIVMLTGVIEGRKRKCEKYWPDVNSTVVYGNINVTMKAEKVYAFYTVRSIQMTKEKDKETKNLTQLHFTSWPDHGVPCTLQLLLFYNKYVLYRDNYMEGAGPVTVHCSAGIGRTGTFIALDVLAQRGNEKRKINVAEYVKCMRKDRMDMIQTMGQYIFLYRALDDYFHNKFHLIKPQELAAHVHNTEIVTKEFLDVKNARIEKKPQEDKSLEENDDTSLEPIIIPSFKQPDGIMFCKYPSMVNVVDFLSIVSYYQPAAIISMYQLSDFPSSAHWMPQLHSLTVGDFKIKERTVDSFTSMQNVVHNLLSIQDKNEEVAVHVFEPKETRTHPDGKFYNNEITHIVESVCNPAITDIGDRPILILNLENHIDSLILATVINAVQQIQMDSEVDLSSIVRIIQDRCPNPVLTYDHYKICYDVIVRYVAMKESDNVYYNAVNEKIYSNT